MRKLNCNVVRDILPLYADDVVSVDTRELVEEHLKECMQCAQELNTMRSQVSVPVSSVEVQQLKKFKSRWSLKQLMKGVAMTLILFAILFGLYYYFYGYGIPILAEDLILEDGLQCVPEYDANENWSVACPTQRQTWVLDLGSTSTGVRFRSEPVYTPNGDGELICTGEKIYIRRALFDMPWDYNGPSRLGYGSADGAAGLPNGDFIITVICADKEFTYSMREEGVFDLPTEKHSAQFCPWAE